MDKHNVIRRPRLTEKSVHLADPQKHTCATYTFEVHPSANKPEIKKAVESLFKVSVKKVATLNCAGKSRRTRLSVGKTADWKKAYVTLAAGESIEGV